MAGVVQVTAHEKKEREREREGERKLAS